jgi:hypothetical protein
MCYSSGAIVCSQELALLQNQCHRGSWHNEGYVGQDIPGHPKGIPEGLDRLVL